MNYRTRRDNVHKEYLIFGANRRVFVFCCARFARSPGHRTHFGRYTAINRPRNRYKLARATRMWTCAVFFARPL